MSSIDDGHERETAEVPAEQAGVDGSAGSDTETTRTLVSDTPDKDAPDDKHHARSNSVKKPTTFKAVSVTKNFLAKAGTTSTPAAKVNGDKAASIAAASGNSLPAALRPRLVAKSASGHQTSAPKSTNLASKNGGANGPDPLQVWNRNRPAPAAAPKHFTDEELKQQYGIHLATRLQADGDGKEAKWADIDDDEDDWAPETIEWNDGTKITLQHTDSAAVLAEEQAAELAMKKKRDEEARAKMPVLKPTSIVGPNATVLRLGLAGQPKAGGLILKTPSDKPSLVAKPSVPAPVRSPWASLPPVDKVPPVPINPPSQSPATRFQQTDTYSSESMPPPPSPAMEIAADSFTRTRRDTPNGNPGQLYNSQSGQYEPVNAARRSSMRKEQNFRPPSLLQRPANNDQNGPAEPSAAFQTHRSGAQQDSGMWNRRASSTFSGDSGPRDRRASMNKGSDQSRIPNDILQQRRESQPLQSPLSPGGTQAKVSQRDDSQPSQPTTSHSQQLNEASSASASPQQSKTSLANPSASSHIHDDLIVQKQLMHEKREAAIKRRKEQEDREEAEKKERIRLKMETLGMLPLEKKEEPKKAIEKREVEKSQSENKVSEVKEPEVRDVEQPKEIVSQTPQIPNQSPEVLPGFPRSPPKPPMPDASGAPKQYGMMKVHGPPMTNGVQPADRISGDRPKVPVTNQQTSPPRQEITPKLVEALPSPTVNGDINRHNADPLVPRSDIARSQDSFRGPRQQPWKNGPSDPDGFPGWNGAGMTTHSSPIANLWGPPSNQNALGNGTFDRSVQRPQPRQPPYQEHFISPIPQPIGPPRHVQRSRESSDSARAPDTVPVPIVEDFQTIPSFPSPDAPIAIPRSRGDFAQQITSGDKSIPSLQPGPGTQPVAERLQRGPEQHRSTLAAWGNFQATSARDDATKRQQFAHEQVARLTEEDRTGVRREAQLPVMKETWRQIQIDGRLNQRQVVGVAKAHNAPDSTPMAQMNGDIRNTRFPTSVDIGAVNGAGRSSRFFPGVGSGMQGSPQRAVSCTADFNRAASPPPPDSVNHPAFALGQQRPLVNLPLPKPKVRLPPSFVTPLQSPTMTEMHTAPLRAVSQPLVNNPSWQDRFNGLLGVKKTSPESKFAQVVEFSATKVPLEVPAVKISAAVSLPPKGEGTVRVVVVEPVVSKASEDEEALFENREFGSLPVVHIPAPVPENVWSTARPSKSHRSQPSRPHSHQPVDAFSKQPFVEKEMRVANGILIFVHMPGSPPGARKSKTMPMSHGQGHINRAQRARHVSGPSKPAKGFKSRESSASYNAPKPAPNGVQRSPMQNVPNLQSRGPFGPRGIDKWAARIAGVAQ